MKKLLPTTDRKRWTKRAFLEGKKVWLCPFGEEDITPEYLSWFLDPEVTRYMRWRQFPSTERLARKFIRENQPPKAVLLAIVDKRTRRHVGNINLHNIRPVVQNAEVALVLGNRRYWNRGYGAEAVRLIVRHAFDTLQLVKVKAGTEVDNMAAVRMFKSLGFVIEARLKNEFYRDGRHRDAFLMAIHRPDLDQRGRLRQR